MGRWLIRIGAAVIALILAGCASTHNPRDPLENFNRSMFKFNDTVDEVAVKPAAIVYRSLTPSFVQTGIGNFFGNLADVPTLANNVLQGKVDDSLTDFMRVAVNTMFGLGGLLDIASEAGLPKHREDFGQTLGKWGVVPGPYVVLPVFGPSTLRDTLALPLDLEADPWFRAEPHELSVAGAVVRVIDQRAALLDASTLIEEAALDRYEFVRDAYLQRRENHVYDGDVPIKKKYDPDAAKKSSAERIKASSQVDEEPGSNNIVESEHSALTAAKSTAPPPVSLEGNASMIKKQALSSGNTNN